MSSDGGVDSWTESVCTRLTTAESDEIQAFLKHAQSLGLVLKSGKDVENVCNRYWAQKKKLLSRESVTGGLRSTDSYTRSAQDIVKLVTIQKGTLPVGSFKFNVHKYASDIDIMERINVCCSVADAKRQVAQAIQKIGRLIRSAPDVYLGDFKAGKDDRFAIDIGAWIPVDDIGKQTATTAMPPMQESSGIMNQIIEFLRLLDNQNTAAPAAAATLYENVNIDNGLVLIGFDATKIEKNVKRLAQEKLISFADMNRLIEIVRDINKRPSLSQWEELSGLLRDNQVLRWNTQELSQGYKILPGFRKLTLEDALGQKTLVKMDAWARVNGRWLEVTNFFMISVVDAAGKVIEQLTQELPDYVKSMSKDVRHYSSPEHRKTLKALKRLWALSLFKNDLALANRINPLFSGNGAALNQIVGDAEVLAMMLAKLDDPPLEQIMEQIDGFKPRIDQLNSISEMNPELFALINSIVEPFYANPINSFTDFDDTITKLETLQEKVGAAVEQMISTDAKRAGLDNPAAFV